MPAAFRRNHYVPEWYQKRFIPTWQADRSLYYLDLRPEIGYRDRTGKFQISNRLHRWGPRKCFAQEDLYTRYVLGRPTTAIEEIFFGQIDREGKKAVEAFSNFSFQAEAFEAFSNLLTYLGAQKLRTPKGLGWLQQQARTSDRDELLHAMVLLRRMYHAIWAECVWQIADASMSETKFIVSDHPVTAYNRAFGPRSQACRGFNDPDVRLHATHTLFPLSPDKVLILTNLSWVRNPYQREDGVRPNPNLARSGIFKLMDVQTGRHLTEHEVLEINFVIKHRALRYVASGKEEWLYPERHVSKSAWANLGQGYLFMPDPRAIHGGGTVIIGYDSGRVDASDEYGRRPWDPEYETGSGPDEGAALDRFKGEFARLFGPRRRGVTWEGDRLEADADSEKLHAYHLSLEERGKRAMRRGRRRS